MRIIGGTARGKRLHVPKGCPIRPTADRLKESLFDILHPVEGVAFLDLFAGCGNVGLEALSRGARRAVFVEKDPRLVGAIRANIKSLGFENRADVIAADLPRGLGRLVQRKERFDILFADPPYDERFVPEVMECLEGVEIVADGGVIVIQHSVREALEGEWTQTMAVIDQRRYGDTMLSFIKKPIEGQDV